MSDPENILARYRSYSYHQMLIVCDSTDTANKLEQRGNITEFQRLRTNQSNFDLKYRGMSVDNPGESGHNYIVLIDGMTDAEFFLSKAEWNTVISPTEQNQANFATVDGKIEVYEPYGANFIKQLVDVSKTLKTDATGLVYMLKTVFVGHNDDAHEHNVEMLAGFRPFLFSLVQLTSVIDESGSTYELDVVGIQNGYAKLPHVNKIGKGFKFTIDKTAPLPLTLKRLQNALNIEYANVAKALGLTLNKAGTQFTGDSKFRAVQYKIDAADYKEVKAVAGDNLDVIHESSASHVIMQFDDDSRIDEIISLVLKSSKYITDEGNQDNEDIFIPKISSVVESTPDEMIIKYEVARFHMKTVPVEDLESKKRPIITSDDNLLTFNYIFTGQNTDILEFDIKMNMGLAFLAQASTASYGFDQAAQKNGSDQKNVNSGNVGNNASEDSVGAKTILYLGDKLTDPRVKNGRNPVSVATYDAMLAKHAALENVLVTMKIHGNPRLMAEMLETHVIDPIHGESKNYFMKSPALIQVNIQMPSNDATSGSFKPFWYPGLYTLHAVFTSFSGGEFTQELTMFSMPTTDKAENVGMTAADDPKPEVGSGKSEGGTPAPAPGVANAQEARAGDLLKQ